jgi:hypothetical protein
VVLPDCAEIRRLLDDLEHGRPHHLTDPAVQAALDRLGAADLLSPPSPERLPSVMVAGPRALAEPATVQLRTAGLPVAADADGNADVHVLLAYGALRRTVVDPLVRDGVPHVIAVLTPWGWDLGPFVVPGATACLRCVDAACTELDPRHGVVVDQVARAAAPVPVDGSQLSAALGWLARDVLAYARGAQPSTWSATWQLGEGAPQERHWLRHPYCGCAWDALTDGLAD